MRAGVRWKQGCARAVCVWLVCGLCGLGEDCSYFSSFSFPLAAVGMKVPKAANLDGSTFQFAVFFDAVETEARCVCECECVCATGPGYLMLLLYVPHASDTRFVVHQKP